MTYPSDEVYRERLFGYAEQVPSECWEWTRFRTKDGYGHMRYKGRMVESHRLALMLTDRPIPDGHEVMHLCDNPPCINPDHLTTGTHAENVADMVAKGRRAVMRGTSNPRARVTDADVIEMRRLYAEGGGTQAQIGAMFGLGKSQAHNVISGRQWAHVPSTTRPPASRIRDRPLAR